MYFLINGRFVNFYKNDELFVEKSNEEIYGESD